MFGGDFSTSAQSRSFVATLAQGYLWQTGKGIDGLRINLKKTGRFFLAAKLNGNKTSCGINDAECTQLFKQVKVLLAFNFDGNKTGCVIDAAECAYLAFNAGKDLVGCQIKWK